MSQRLSLDTHIYLWALGDSKKLDNKVRRQMAAADEVLVSAVWIWGMAIKMSLGKLEADVAEAVVRIADSGFSPLPVSVQHGVEMALLPWHHHDPFDRLLTADAQLACYGEMVTVV